MNGFDGGWKLNGIQINSWSNRNVTIREIHVGSHKFKTLSAKKLSTCLIIKTFQITDIIRSLQL